MCENKGGLTTQWILLNLSAVFIFKQVSSLTELSLWPQEHCDCSNGEVMLCEGGGCSSRIGDLRWYMPLVKP